MCARDCRSLNRESSAEREARAKRRAAEWKKNIFGMQSSVDSLMIGVTFKHFDTAADFGWANRRLRHRLSPDRVKRRIISRNEIINQLFTRFAFASSRPIHDSDRERNSSLFLSLFSKLPCGLRVGHSSLGGARCSHCFSLFYRRTKFDKNALKTSINLTVGYAMHFLSPVLARRLARLERIYFHHRGDEFRLGRF